jgi:hypothetical protein
MTRLNYGPQREALTRRDRPLHKPGDSPGAASILVLVLFFAGWIALIAAVLLMVRERPRGATPPPAAEWNWHVR